MKFQQPVQSAFCATSLREQNDEQPGVGSNPGRNTREPAFEELVDQYYRSLYQFALSLTHSEADACDLAQETFLTWSAKGGQLRDGSKVRSWLFTTLHRAFLQVKRRQTRFPHYELEEVHRELPELPAVVESRVDGVNALDALQQMDEVFRAPLALFYLEDCPYKEIAKILGIPLGTVKSRIARGLLCLQKALRPDGAILERAAA